MKRLFFPVLLALGVGSLAFVPSHPQAPPTRQFTVHEFIAFDTLLSVPCLGEDMHMYGTVAVTHHLTITGNHFVERVVHVPRDVVGVGLTSGTQWIGAGQTQYIHVGSLTGGQALVGYVNDMIVISKGPASNLLVRDNILTRVYPDGTVESVVEHSSVECR